MTIEETKLRLVSLIEMRVNTAPLDAAFMSDAWNAYIETLKDLIRNRIRDRFTKPVFSNACEILAEVINEELDVGFDFSDEQLERIAELVDDYPHDGLAEATSEWKKRV